jgi:hypothetical protein
MVEPVVAGNSAENLSYGYSASSCRLTYALCKACWNRDVQDEQDVGEIHPVHPHHPVAACAAPNFADQ